MVHSLLFREDTPTPSFVVDITDHINTKLAALACFESQFGSKTTAGEGKLSGEASVPFWIK